MKNHGTHRIHRSRSRANVRCGCHSVLSVYSVVVTGCDVL